MKFGDLGLGGLRIRMRGSRSKYHIIAAVKKQSVSLPRQNAHREPYA